MPCPAGTYGDITQGPSGDGLGRTAASECQDCLDMQYCDEVGLTAPTGYCEAGF